MRIVYVSWEYPPSYGGGIGTYVHAMAHALTAAGHEVTVVTVGPAGHPVRESDGGVRVIRLPLPVHAGPEPMATLAAWQNRAEAVHDILAKLHRAEPFDVLEFADYRGEASGWLARKGPSERPVTVVRLHTSLGVLQKYDPAKVRYCALEEYENAAILAADRVVAPSGVLAREVRGMLPEMGAIDVSPHPVDPFFLDAGATAAPHDSNEVLYVGRLQELKGVETLIRAAEAFLDACPDAWLALVGGDTEAGPGRPSMRRVLLDLLPGRFHARVEMPGALPREQLMERYRSARFCVFPSHYDNFPNTCLEAMALGKCVIGTRNSGMVEMIEGFVGPASSRSVDRQDAGPTRSGLLVDSADVRGLAEALIRVYRMSAAERAHIGSAARERVLSTYRPDLVAERVVSLYNGYISAHSYRPPAVTTKHFGQPRVAIVIPCFNHGAFLPQAVESANGQSYPHVECVVVDDGSTDAATLTVLEEMRHKGLRVISQANGGLASARNTGVRATDAEFFVPLDADDRIEPNFVEKLLPPLLQDPSLGYCYPYARYFGVQEGVWECPAYDSDRLLMENLSVATAVVRRTAFDCAGGYSPDMIHGYEDWDFWVALLACGYTGRLVPEPLFLYRKHAEGSMLTRAQARREEMHHRIVEHHRGLFATMLKSSRVVAAPADDEVFRTLQARAELDFIENSRFWRGTQRLKRTAAYQAFARMVYGSGWEAHLLTRDARERLRRIKASRMYRSIQAIKRTPFYKIYARAKYGAK